MPELKTPSFSLQDKVAVITGGGGAMGRILCDALAGAGARIVAADINLEAAEETAQNIIAAGGDAIAVKTDVASAESTLAMAKAATDKWGRIDILVNNAALYATLTRAPFYEMDLDEWEKVMAVNLKGPVLCARAVYPAMKATGGGRIIHVSSATVYTGPVGLSHYAASKAGIIGMMRSMAKEVGEAGITVNSVAPHYMVTEASLELFPGAFDFAVDWGAIKRRQTPDDLAGLVVFLSSDSSDFITGQIFTVDGGRLLR